MNPGKLIALMVVVGLVAAFFVFDLGSYLTLENIKSEQARLDALVEANPVQFVEVSLCSMSR